MEFFTVSREKRPVRLSEKTRAFAYESLRHKYGLEAMDNFCIRLDSIPGYADMSEIDRYDTAIREIALRSPIRICENEKISGAATLGKAITHYVPAECEGVPDIFGISHLTVDFETVLRRGINGISDDIEKSLKTHTDAREKRFLESCRKTVESMKIWHGRYLDALKNKKGYESNYRNLLRVPFDPAENFCEAVQSIWFTFSFIRLCGNWPGIGRLDWLLGDYLKKDLSNGVLTLGEAREILAHFFIKGCEWIHGTERGSGDAQHYQNIVLAGNDGKGGDVTNEVSYLVLDIIEELGISDFPTTVRLNKNTDEKFLRRLSEVLRFGGGILAFYNEDLIMESLRKYGYPESDIWKFANDGCWEIQIPGKTFFNYHPFDALQILQKDAFKGYSEDIDYKSFEELYGAFKEGLYRQVETIFNYRLSAKDKSDKWSYERPCTVVSVFEGGCIENARSYLECGPVYNVASPHIGGLPDAVNSLYAIKKTVFDEKRISFPEFMSVLRNNWENNEALRLLILNGYDYYGNDNDECDEIAVRILSDFASICRSFDGRCNYVFPAGVSTFGRQLQWLPDRLASPHGHKKDAVLAANFSPTPGSDKEGATAIIRSYCKADLSEMVTGAALDLKLLASTLEGDDGIDTLVSLLRGFVALGGCFIQPDVEDKEILKAAQEHPEDYQTLSVRVSGWNARFVTLNKEWQDMVINDTK